MSGAVLITLAETASERISTPKLHSQIMLVLEMGDNIMHIKFAKFIDSLKLCAKAAKYDN